MDYTSLSPVLIVEDDRKTVALISLYLQREGFKTIVAHDGQQALELAQQGQPSFVVLDLMLPRLDGWEVCRRLRRTSDVPILILTAREEELDRIVGLSIGADDYVVKPFSPQEVVARVKAILRRVQRTVAASKEQVAHRGLVLDLAKRKVTLHGQPLALTPFEYKLLQTFMTAPGRLFTREELLDQLYPGGEVVIDRVVDVHISKLRQKIGEDPALPRYILTVRGMGYRFAEDQE
ncbi:MAG: response regulator transcription factor [Candidatus Entotheonellia bacterium]